MANRKWMNMFKWLIVMLIAISAYIVFEMRVLFPNAPLVSFLSSSGAVELIFGGQLNGLPLEVPFILIVFLPMAVLLILMTALRRR